MGGFSFLATDTKNSVTFYVFHFKINPSLIFHMLLRDLHTALKGGEWGTKPAFNRETNISQYLEEGLPESRHFKLLSFYLLKTANWPDY